jgi:hypothetical protein
VPAASKYLNYKHSISADAVDEADRRAGYDRTAPFLLHSRDDAASSAMSAFGDGAKTKNACGRGSTRVLKWGARVGQGETGLVQDNDIAA